MKISENLVEATLLCRLNRFMCLVRLGDRDEEVYLPNSGRLPELLVPERTVFLAERGNPTRKSQYDLILVKLESELVCVDARIANEILHKGLCEKTIAEFTNYSLIRREVPFGKSRLDFVLEKAGKQCFLEVKSVTLVREGKAFFPDAPTSRGTRHLEDLIQAIEKGHEAAVVFVIQRKDTAAFSPNDAVDRNFADALRKAYQKGVQIHAYRCWVRPDEIELEDEVPVFL